MRTVIAKTMQGFFIFIYEVKTISYVLHFNHGYTNSENYFSISCSEFHYRSETNFINGYINRVISGVTVINTIRFQALAKYGMLYAFA